MSVFKRYELHFFTATILEWKMLLLPDKYKDIIIDSLKFLVKEERVIIHGFVIMSNHIHIIWHCRHPHKRENIQRDFLKFTAQKIKFDLIENHPEVLRHFKVNAKDREYQFWEINPLSIDIWTEAVVKQKLNYIHENPLRAGLVKNPVEYLYSSARYYETGIDDWGVLTPL
ncbi:transposase [Taibaiella lutea]|uniref:Transposase n=1 Tax=Taibaiella lutea TaxID=2608001 RepID=A0A5M6CGX5_9BACT|nr:transposase [Taibaiella lutea]KAA5534454.1 transposase [Taibaiella lutea]